MYMEAEMIRTTIMLPNDLKTRAVHWAQQRGASLGEIVREALEIMLKISKSKSTTISDPFFEDTAVYKGKAPKDLALNHDTYLYGDNP